MIEQPPDFFASSDAECRHLGIDGVRIMNPEQGDLVAESAARTICESCVFVEPCKEWGMKHKDVGVYGAMTRDERLKLSRKRTRVHHEQSKRQ